MFPQTQPFFETSPKIDLHRHLTGSIRFETWVDILRQRGKPLPFENLDDLRAALTMRGQSSLKDYLRRFDLIDQCLMDTAAVEQITYEAIANANAENLIYLELRFSPSRIARVSQLSVEQVLEAIIAGRDRARTDFPVLVNLIAGLSRELGVRTCAEQAEIISGYARHGISGIDLLGNETDFPAAWFAPVFQPLARKGVLGITIHAGEAGDAENVKAAVLELGASRIGHGIRAGDDPVVMRILKEHNITLELCPSSNVQTCAVQDYASHPLKRFLLSGLRVTVNTDNPCISQINLAHEYQAAISQVGLTEAELARTLFYAAEAAFAAPEIKRQLKDRLQGWLNSAQEDTHG